MMQSAEVKKLSPIRLDKFSKTPTFLKEEEIKSKIDGEKRKMLDNQFVS
jgi:hypothetical protein